MKQKGPALQQSLTEKTAGLVQQLQSVCKKYKAPVSVITFGSLWRIRFEAEMAYGDLLFALMREKGIHILDGFPCYMTEAITNQDIEQIVKAFEESLSAMVAVELIPGTTVHNEEKASKSDMSLPPVPGARLGRDKQGNPAWFITDPQRPGKYLQLN